MYIYTEKVTECVYGEHTEYVSITYNVGLCAKNSGGVKDCGQLTTIYLITMTLLTSMLMAWGIHFCFQKQQARLRGYFVDNLLSYLMLLWYSFGKTKMQTH